MTRRKDQWFVVHVLSGQENKVCDNLAQAHQDRGDGRLRLSKSWFPTERVSEIKRGKKTETTRKFFPGYLIVNM